MKFKFDSKQFGITLFIIYIILTIPLIFLLIKTGDDLNELAMNPGFITPDEIREDYPKLFFIIIFSFIIGLISILSFLFYIRRNKTTIDFDETIDIEYWQEEQNRNTSKDIAKSKNDDKTELYNLQELNKEFSHLKKETSKEKKSTVAIQILSKQLKAGFGAIYLTNSLHDTKYLEFCAGYAFFRPKDNSSKILFGEGLTGQVAKSQKSIVIDHLDDVQVTILSGLGKSSPTSLIIVPIIRNKKTIGVMEIASFHKITGVEKTFLTEASNFLASEL